jgi:hypothetical protein
VGFCGSVCNLMTLHLFPLHSFTVRFFVLIFFLYLFMGGGGWCSEVRTGDIPDILDRRWLWLHITRLCAKVA